MRVAILLLGCVACGRGGGRTTAADAGRPAAAALDAGLAPPAPAWLALDRVEVEAALWPDVAGRPPADEEVAAKVRELLVVAPPPGARTARARLRLEYGIDLAPAAGKKPPRLQAAVMMRLDAGDEIQLSENVLAEIDAPGDAGRIPEAARALALRAIGDAAKGLRAKDEVRRGDPPAVLAALDSPDPELRSLAFATVAERRLTEAVPRLIELLGSEDGAVRDGAIGALAALRDPRGVKPLTEIAKFQDHDMMRRIIDAIGAIGGEEARSYLEFVAQGHEHPLIREMAAQALARLERREGKPKR